MLCSVTCTAPVNIAVIKYWGKRHEQLILPLNDSVSVTLSQEYMCARTTVRAVRLVCDGASGVTDQQLEQLQFWLNGEQQPVTERLTRCVRLLYQSAVDRHGQLPPHRLVIESTNSFPTAAGLASSAAGCAALATAVARLYCVDDSCGAPASIAAQAARLGSGSACRSMLGGFVRWRRGNCQDGSDSLPEQVAPASHWPDLRCLILVVCDSRKSLSSSRAMQHTVLTSSLMPARLAAQSTAPSCPAPDTAPVHTRADGIGRAIIDRDFATFAELAMRDSNEMHAVCAAALPPVHYMTDTSRAVVRLVHAFNTWRQRAAVCYTFDAGANACCYLLSRDVPSFVAAVRQAFPPAANPADWLRGDSSTGGTSEELEAAGENEERFVWSESPIEMGGIKYVISTTVGEGPRVVCQE